MRQPSFRQAVCSAMLGLFYFGALMWTGLARGDQVEMINGDRYVGRVISLGNDTLVLQNEFLGVLKLPRARISTIAFGSIPSGGTNSLRVTPSAFRSNRVAQVSGRISTNTAPDFASAMHELGTNSSVIQQVQQQLLTGAGPEAQSKFNDLVAGLLSGKVGVNELRTQAKTTLEQARGARKELGEEGGSSLDSYLAILESFLKETEPSTSPTNSAATLAPGAAAQKPSAEE